MLDVSWCEIIDRLFDSKVFQVGLFFRERFSGRFVGLISCQPYLMTQVLNVVIQRQHLRCTYSLAIKAVLFVAA